MSEFHLKTTLTKTDAVFHIRLYGFADPTDYSAGTHGLMALHLGSLDAPVEIDPSLVLADGLGEWEQQYEDQFFQGAQSFSNLKFTLKADPVLAPLVATIRHRGDIWIEVVMEQFALDVPAVPAGEMLWPRKKRLYFWGRLLVQESKLHLKSQQRTKSSYNNRSNFIANQAHRDHLGRLDLSFVHWFKAITAGSPEAFLDDFYTGHGGGVANSFVRMSEILDELVNWITPSQLHAVADHRLTTTDADEGTAKSVARCNFPIATWISGSSSIIGAFIPSGTIVTDVNELYRIGLRLTLSTGDRYGVFYKDPAGKDHGKYSLYNISSVGELLVAFCEEWQLKFQIELPTLEESYLMSEPSGGSTLKNRTAHWLACTRWLFFDARIPASGLAAGGIEVYATTPGGLTSDTVKVPKAIFVDPLDDVVDADPCPSWLGKITVTDPFADGDDDVMHATVIGESADGAKDISIKTLFGFVPFTMALGSANFEYPAGAELYIWSKTDDINPVYAHQFQVIRIGTNADGSLFPDYSKRPWNWSFWQAYRLDDFWNGQDVCTVEFDFPGVGIEPFGASAGMKNPGIRTFDLWDFGEFPMFRFFRSNPSILLDQDTIGEFRVFQMKRSLGQTKIGTTHIKAIVVMETTNTVEPLPPVAPPGPPDPPDPPTIDPPPFITEPQCGVTNFIFGVSYDGDCIGSVVVMLDGAPIATFPGWDNSGMHGAVTPISVTIDFCLIPLGTHTITVTVTPCDDGAPGIGVWTFTVNHDCCSDSTAKFLHLP
jgi:hypothetical protein